MWPLTDKDFTPGSQLPDVVLYEGVKIAMMICYDVEFPELVRAMVLKGSQLIVVPTADTHISTATIMVRTRALENHVYLAYANHCGQEGHIKYAGLSSFINPDGDIIVSAEDEESLLKAVINVELCTPKGPSYLTHRRPELYASIAN